MLRRSLVALAVTAPIALTAASPAAASADATAQATAASTASHCYIFRPAPKYLIEYAQCRINEIIAPVS